MVLSKYIKVEYPLQTVCTRFSDGMLLSMITQVLYLKVHYVVLCNKC